MCSFFNLLRHLDLMKHHLPDKISNVCSGVISYVWCDSCNILIKGLHLWAQYALYCGKFAITI